MYTFYRKEVSYKIHKKNFLHSKVGGYMGLLLGASVITVAELLELIVTVCARWCTRLRG